MTKGVENVQPSASFIKAIFFLGTFYLRFSEMSKWNSFAGCRVRKDIWSPFIHRIFYLEYIYLVPLLLAARFLGIRPRTDKIPRSSSSPIQRSGQHPFKRQSEKNRGYDVGGWRISTFAGPEEFWYRTQGKLDWGQCAESRDFWAAGEFHSPNWRAILSDKMKSALACRGKIS